MVFAIILFLLLLVSLFGNFAQMVARVLPGHRAFRGESFRTAREIGPKLDECILEDNNADDKIAVIEIDGIITSHVTDQSGNSMVDIIKAQLDRAKDDRHVKAVLLKVDSPGGEVLASDDIYHAIRDFQTDTSDDNSSTPHRGKPVICSMGSLAASGGYYISSGSRWIVANNLTLTGSIGVIMHGWNYRGLMDKVGVSPMTYKSGKFKDMLSGERATNEIPEGEHEMVQNLIMETYGTFTNVVADGRGNAHNLNKSEGHKLADKWMDFADGRVVTGKQALDLGLVDELGDFDGAVNRAEKIAHLDKANLIEYRQRYDISNLLSLFGQSSEAHDIKLELDTDTPKLQAGLMYFLYEP